METHSSEYWGSGDDGRGGAALQGLWGVRAASTDVDKTFNYSKAEKIRRKDRERGARGGPKEKQVMPVAPRAQRSLPLPPTGAVLRYNEFQTMRP